MVIVFKPPLVMVIVSRFDGKLLTACVGPKQLNAHAQEFVVSEQSLALNHQDQIARPENTLPKTPANPVKAKAMAFLNSIAAEADSRPASRTTTPIAIRPQYMGNNTFPSHAPASYEVRPVGYPGHNMAQQPAWNPFGATIVTGPLLQPTRAAVVPNTRANITAGSIECFYCGLPGHWKQFCPSRRCAVCGHAGTTSLSL